jgi:hypothetical protein
MKTHKTFTKADEVMTIRIYLALLKHSKEVFIDPTINILDMILPIINGVHKDIVTSKVDESINCNYFISGQYLYRLCTITEGNTIGNVTTILVDCPCLTVPLEVNYYLPNLILESKETKVLSDCMRRKVKKEAVSMETPKTTCNKDSREYFESLYKSILDTMASFSLNSEVPTYYDGMTTVRTHLSTTFPDDLFTELDGNISCEPSLGRLISIQIITASKRFFTIKITNTLTEAYAILPLYWKE